MLAGLLAAGCGGGTTTASTPAGSTPPTAGSTITLAWEGPITNSDPGNTSLTDLARFRVYLSSVSGSYSGSPTREVNAAAPGTTQQVSIDNLAPGTYYAIVTAVDVHGNESQHSNEIVVTLP